MNVCVDGLLKDDCLWELSHPRTRHTHVRTSCTRALTSNTAHSHTPKHACKCTQTAASAAQRVGERANVCVQKRIVSRCLLPLPLSLSHILSLRSTTNVSARMTVTAETLCSHWFIHPRPCRYVRTHMRARMRLMRACAYACVHPHVIVH